MPSTHGDGYNRGGQWITCYMLLLQLASVGCIILPSPHGDGYNRGGQWITCSML